MSPVNECRNYHAVGLVILSSPAQDERMKRHQTALYQLLTEHLDRDVIEVIVDARKDGESYAMLAGRLTYELGIPVSFETLRNWHRQYEEEHGS